MKNQYLKLLNLPLISIAIFLVLYYVYLSVTDYTPESLPTLSPQFIDPFEYVINQLFFNFFNPILPLLLTSLLFTTQYSLTALDNKNLTFIFATATFTFIAFILLYKVIMPLIYIILSYLMSESLIAMLDGIKSSLIFILFITSICFINLFFIKKFSIEEPPLNITSSTANHFITISYILLISTYQFGILITFLSENFLHRNIYFFLITGIIISITYLYFWTYDYFNPHFTPENFATKTIKASCIALICFTILSGIFVITMMSLPYNTLENLVRAYFAFKTPISLVQGLFGAIFFYILNNQVNSESYRRFHYGVFIFLAIIMTIFGVMIAGRFTIYILTNYASTLFNITLMLLISRFFIRISLERAFP